MLYAVAFWAADEENFNTVVENLLEKRKEIAEIWKQMVEENNSHIVATDFNKE